MTMTQQQFGQAILECFSEVYGNCYIGSLFINKLDPIGFDIAIGFNHRETPIHIIGEYDDKEFLEYFKKELKSRHLNTNHFGSIRLETQNLKSNYDTKRTH